jgi:hypothetical protein
MNTFCRTTLQLLLGILMAIGVQAGVARADDDWEERWEDYEEELEERREAYEDRLEDRRDVLEEYWEGQRQVQRGYGLRRGHAWYGYYGPYYGDRLVPQYRGYGPSQFFGPTFAPGYFSLPPELPCLDHGYGPTGFGCHDDLDASGLSIGPLRVFWD